MSCRPPGATRRRRARALAGAALLLVAAAAIVAVELRPLDEHRPRATDGRYPTQSGSLDATRRQAVRNAAAEVHDAAAETCAATGRAGLAARYGVAASAVDALAARFADDALPALRSARRSGCLEGLREGG